MSATASATATATASATPAMHGWYSAAADLQTGYYIYLSQDGLSEVKVTQVSSDPNSYYNFADKKYVGLVGDFVRSTRTHTARLGMSYEL